MLMTVLMSSKPADLHAALETFPGRNSIEKSMAMIRATVHGADEWTFEHLHEQACELNKKLTYDARAALLSGRSRCP